jgi:hypothetical protein
VVTGATLASSQGKRQGYLKAARQAGSMKELRIVDCGLRI